MSQAGASILLVLAMFGLAVYLVFAPPPGFDENMAYRLTLPFVLVATAFSVLENLRTRTHVGQLVGAIRGLLGRAGVPADPKVKAEAVEILIRSLRSETESVRATAAKELRNLTGQQFGEEPARWESWWETHKDRFKEGKS
ncbi:MAG: hypothetical protein ACYTGV_17285 [Planctomycetota bacterium]